MNPPSLTVSAPATGSRVTLSPTSHRSRTSSSGSRTPRTCNAIRMSYPIIGSAVRPGILTDLVPLAGPLGQVERHFPGLIDGDQPVRLNVLVIRAARTEEQLGESHALGQRINDPVGRNPGVRIELSLVLAVPG